MTDFVPHRVEWTREKSSRFWDQLSSMAGPDQNYFSAEMGSSLIGFARAAGVDLKGRVLDFGCGPGHLILKLMAAGITVEGADFSPSSIERLRKAAEGNPKFGGAHVITSIPTHLPEGSFSTVFFIETIEHLLDGDLEATIAELHRIVRPGGFVVVSTPNEEKLATFETVCPDCGAAFHAVQHVRSWNSRTISECMTRFGFETVTVRPWYLDRQWWRSRVITTAARVLGKHLPHLVYVGRRQA